MKERVNLILIIISVIFITHIETRRHHRSRLLDIKNVQDENSPYAELINRINKNNHNGINFLQVDTKNQPYENKDSEADKSENQTIFDLIITHNKHIREHGLENVDILKKSITTIKIDDKESKQVNVVVSVKKEKQIEFWCNELNMKKKDDRIEVKSQFHEKFQKVTQALKKCGFENFLGEEELLEKDHKDKPQHHHNVDTEKEIKNIKDGKTENTKKNEDAYYKDENTEKSLKKDENSTKTETQNENGTSSSSSQTTNVSYSNKTSTGDIGEFPEDFDF